MIYDFRKIDAKKCVMKINNILCAWKCCSPVYFSRLSINRVSHNNHNEGIKWDGYNKDKDSISNTSGVYKLVCYNCNYFYIGKTSRNFNVRIKELLRCLNNYSEIANHILIVIRVFMFCIPGYPGHSIKLDMRKCVNSKLNIIIYCQPNPFS